MTYITKMKLSFSSPMDIMISFVRESARKLLTTRTMRFCRAPRGIVWKKQRKNY